MTRTSARPREATRRSGMTCPRLGMPVMLVCGGDSVFVTAEDLAEATGRLPTMEVEVVTGAGHAVQSDQPLALAALINPFVPGA